MRRVFLELSLAAPMAASLLALALPVMSLWPSKEVQPPLFCRAFMIGRSRLAWATFRKLELV